MVSLGALPDDISRLRRLESLALVNCQVGRIQGFQHRGSAFGALSGDVSRPRRLESPAPVNCRMGRV